MQAQPNKMDGNEATNNSNPFSSSLQPSSQQQCSLQQASSYHQGADVNIYSEGGNNNKRGNIKILCIFSTLFILFAIVNTIIWNRNYKSVQEIDSLQNAASMNHTHKLQQSTMMNSSLRVSLGNPKKHPQHLSILTIEPIIYSNTNQNGMCMVMNTLPLVSNRSIRQVYSMFKNGTLSKAIILIQRSDRKAHQIVHQLFNGCHQIDCANASEQNIQNSSQENIQNAQLNTVNSKSDGDKSVNNNKQQQRYNVTEFNITMTSDYTFIRNHLSPNNCNSIVYLSAKIFIQNELLADVITDMKEQHQQTKNQTNNAMTVTYTSGCQSKINQSISLQNIDLSSISDEQIQQYILIFNPSLLYVISPLSFSYYTFYTVPQILVLPVIALAHSSKLLNYFNHNNLIRQCKHSRSFQHHEFKLNPVTSYKRNALQKQLCFVSYTSEPSHADFDQFVTYARSIRNMSKQPNTMYSFVIYAPYVLNNQTNNHSIGLMRWAQQLILLAASSPRIHGVRLRIMYNQTLSAHAIYQSAYLYCSPQSTLVISRHNIKFYDNFGTQLSEHISARYLYYQLSYQLISQTKTVSTQADIQDESNLYYSHNSQISPIRMKVQFPQKHTYTSAYMVRNNITHYNSYYRSVMVASASLVRSLPFWILKCKQLQFYQTQAVVFVALMESIRLDMLVINDALFQVYARQHTKNQINQIRNIGRYAQQPQLPQRMPSPYIYNCLQNPAYSRRSVYKIPPILHQIWLSSSPISPIRQYLHSTLSKHNPEYSVHLWKSDNITVDNFPLTFALLARSMEYQKTSTRSYLALVADLMRYQILYHNGGIYIDFKMEVMQALDTWRKYQLFFIDAGQDATRFKSPLAVGVGIIGANIHNYHLYITLTQLISQSSIDYRNQYIPSMTGGVVVRKSLTDEQLFTNVGFGYHLFIPKPASGGVNDCGTVKILDPDQQIFLVDDPHNPIIKYSIGLPCRQYPQAYILSYKPLASSWKGNKRVMK